MCSWNFFITSIFYILFVSFPSAAMCAESDMDIEVRVSNAFKECRMSTYLYFEVGSDGFPIRWSAIPLCVFEKIRKNDSVLCGSWNPYGSLIGSECVGTIIHPNNKIFLQKRIKGKDLIELISKNKKKDFFDYFYVEDFRIHPISRVTLEKNGEILLHTKFNNTIRLRDNSYCAFGKAENGYKVIDGLKGSRSMINE